MNSLAKRFKKNGDSSAVAILKDTRQLGCISQDMEPPQSSSISRKSAKILKPIRRAQTIKATLRLANIRENKGPLLAGILSRRSSPAQPRCAKIRGQVSGKDGKARAMCPRSCVWKLAKNIMMLREKDKSSFFSSTEDWCLPAPFETKPEEREFVVDSKTSMHVLSRKDLNTAALETVRISKSPTTIVASQWRSENNEETTVYVRELDLFLTVKPTSGPVVKNHISSKMADGYNWTRRTTYRSLSVVWRHVLPSQARQHPHLQHRHRRILKVQHLVQHQYEVTVTVSEYR